MIALVDLEESKGMKVSINICSIIIIYHFENAHNVVFGAGDTDFIVIDDNQYKNLINAIDYYRSEP